MNIYHNIFSDKILITVKQICDPAFAIVECILLFYFLDQRTIPHLLLLNYLDKSDKNKKRAKNLIDKIYPFFV